MMWNNCVFLPAVGKQTQGHTYMMSGIRWGWVALNAYECDRGGGPKLMSALCTVKVAQSENSALLWNFTQLAPVTLSTSFCLHLLCAPRLEVVESAWSHLHKDLYQPWIIWLMLFWPSKEQPSGPKSPKFWQLKGNQNPSLTGIGSKASLRLRECCRKKPGRFGMQVQVQDSWNLVAAILPGMWAL